jgi:hypothetical protein
VSDNERELLNRVAALEYEVRRLGAENTALRAYAPPELPDRPTLAEAYVAVNGHANLSRDEQKARDRWYGRREAGVLAKQEAELKADKERREQEVKAAQEDLTALASNMAFADHDARAGRIRVDEFTPSVEAVFKAVARLRAETAPGLVRSFEASQATAKLSAAEYEERELNRLPALRERLPLWGSDLPPTRPVDLRQALGGDQSAALAITCDSVHASAVRCLDTGPSFSGGRHSSSRPQPAPPRCSGDCRHCRGVADAPGTGGPRRVRRRRRAHRPSGPP